MNVLSNENHPNVVLVPGDGFLSCEEFLAASCPFEFDAERSCF